MEGKKKRSAKRKFDRITDNVPFMTTEELVERHLANSDPKRKTGEDNENGKEDFDNLLFLMSKPDSD